MIGEALRLIRIYHDKKLKDLAEAFDISPSFLSEIENGKRDPNLELIERYASLFKIRASAILFFSEEIEKNGIRGKLKNGIRSNMISFLKLIERYKEIEKNDV